MPVIGSQTLRYLELPGRRAADPLAGRADAGSSIRVVEVPAGPRTPHRHPHSCEVIYVAAGTGRVWEGEHATQVSAGDVVLIERGMPHATINTGADPLRLVCFFPRPDLAQNLEELDGPVRH